MKRTVMSQCPYCSYVNKFNMEFPDMYGYRKIVSCDSDDGPGCGREYVIELAIEIKATARKIEG